MAAVNNGSKTDVIVKLVLVFFISILSFSIGTFVGKKFSDNQHKIAQLEPRSSTGEQDREVASVNPASSEAKPKGALNDEEIKKLAEEFVSDDEGKKATHADSATAAHGEAASHGEAATATPHAESATTSHSDAATNSDAATHGEAPAKHEAAATKPAEAMPAKHQAATVSPEAPSKAAERVVAGHSAAPEVKAANQKEANRIPQSLPKELSSSAIGKFTVQIASYPTEDEAQKVAGDLKEKGFSSFYVPAKIKDKKTKSEKTWFRVSVGLFNTQKEAELYKTDLLSRAKVSSAIIQKITE